MFDRRVLLTALPCFLVLASAAAVGAAPAASAADRVWLTTKDGRVEIQLRPDLAPKAVARIETLVRQGFYNGLKFHRVIAGFMAQTGDPTGTGSGGSQLPDLPAEFTQTPFVRGTLGMARTSDPDTANSQFFICFDNSSFLNGKYTVVGQVMSGMNLIDKVKKGDSESGAVATPDVIVKMEMADAKSAPAKSGVQ
jgi:peptidylprolyl isomerase